MNQTPAPDVSVVLATRDRAARLARALAAIDAQKFDGSFELIVVDDASRDGTPELLARREGAGGAGSIRVIRREEPGGPAGARNTGWRTARAPFVAFTDDDCEPAPGWLAELVATAAAKPESFVQGVTIPNPAERRGPYSRTLEVRALGPWFPTANMAYPRALLERLGGFDESLPRGEDTDLAWRAREVGAEPALAPAALVHHAVMEPGPIGKLRVALAWTPAFRNFTRHPGLREELRWGLFWKRSHALLLLALAGAGLGRRFPPALLLAVPYLRDVRARMAVDGAEPPAALYYPVHDAVETGAAAAGSLRHGTLVL